MFCCEHPTINKQLFFVSYPFISKQAYIDAGPQPDVVLVSILLEAVAVYASPARVHDKSTHVNSVHVVRECDTLVRPRVRRP